MYEKGWFVDRTDNRWLYYYDTTTERKSHWKCEVLFTPPTCIDEVTLCKDSFDFNKGSNEYSLGDLFFDKFNPTEAERALFLLETGIPYVDQGILDKIKR